MATVTAGDLLFAGAGPCAAVRPKSGGAATCNEGRRGRCFSNRSGGRRCSEGSPYAEASSGANEHHEAPTTHTNCDGKRKRLSRTCFVASPATCPACCVGTHRPGAAVMPPVA